LRFGSKIDSFSDEKAQYHKVKEIVSPELMVLDDDLKIRLIGVKPIPEKNSEAIKFLKEKLKRQRVFLKFDNVKYDEENNLLCYLYLWNKTFINAHLIKNGLVDVDTAFDYKYKMKFLSLRNGLIKEV